MYLSHPAKPVFRVFGFVNVAVEDMFNEGNIMFITTFELQAFEK